MKANLSRDYICRHIETLVIVWWAKTAPISTTQSLRVSLSSCLAVATLLFVAQDINQIEIEGLLTLATVMLSNI